MIKLRRDAREAQGEPRYPHIIRTDSGLTIDGSRLTLYSIMDLVIANYPPEYIKTFNLTDEKTTTRLTTLKNIAGSETEYQLVLKQAEENRIYWEERNREHLAKVAAMPPKPEYAEIYKKLKEHREKYKA